MTEPTQPEPRLDTNTLSTIGMLRMAASMCDPSASAESLKAVRGVLRDLASAFESGAIVIASTQPKDN
jgi:hypothetical protein